MPGISNPVTAGVNATAAQYNDLRTDAKTRLVRFVFFIKDTVAVGNDAANQYLIPAAMTVTKIKTKLSAGSATIRVNADATVVKAGVSVTTTAADDSTITNPSLTEGQVLTLDVTAVASSPANLIVEVFATETY